jgi:hypothetical protein
MTVTVEPREFRYVLFDAAQIEQTVARVLDLVTMTDRDVHVDIDEASSVVQVRVVTVTDSTIVLQADSGAFEDTRRPRRFSPEVTTASVGRVLLRLRDRAEPAFADAPGDDALSHAQSAGWDTWSMTRLGRLGLRVHEPRWRYSYRNRHGFTDAADRSFDRIWTAPSMTWADLEAISAAARSVGAAR